MTKDFIKFLQNFSGDLDGLRGVMRDNLGTEVSLISEMRDDYLVGGKRVRAVVCLLAGRLAGLDSGRAEILAAAIEFIHTATLLHDDVVDDAPTRRHLPAAARVYGNAAAVLAGDFLYSRASQMLSGLEKPKLLRRVADATNKLAEGEILQLLNRGKTEMSEATYFAIIRRKTANLFALAAAAPALVAGAAEAPLAEYGRRLGTAFQLIDDCLDYAGDARETGKKVGVDFGEGKMTLPLILMLDGLGAGRRRELAALWRGGGGFGEARDLVEASGALEKTRSLAAAEAAAALRALEGYADCAAKAQLQELAESSVLRRA